MKWVKWNRSVVTAWTAAHSSPTMGFSRRKSGSGLPSPPPVRIYTQTYTHIYHIYPVSHPYNKLLNVFPWILEPNYCQSMLLYQITEPKMGSGEHQFTASRSETQVSTWGLRLASECSLVSLSPQPVGNNPNSR